MKKLAIIIGIFTLLTACSKDQKVVRRLADGEWEVTGYSIDGESQPDSTFSGNSYTFEKCKVSKEDCEGRYTYTDPDKGSTSSSFKYSISDKGEKITIKIDLYDTGITVSTTYDIVVNEKDKFVWSDTNEDGEVKETTIEKK